MGNLAVIGTQWGDEGKGKIVHFLAEKADWIARYQGGNNAGHTVVFGNEIFIMHVLPSGVLYPDKKCIIGNGVVIDPAALVEEIDFIESKGLSTKGRLFISDIAHIILPYHCYLDGLREKTQKIGTTRKGIGPAYADKVARIGIRMTDFLNPVIFEKLVKANIKNPLLSKLNTEEIFDKYPGWRERLAEYVTDTTMLVNQAIDKGENILFESAQGTLLDLDFGTYPYVTSSNPVAGGICVGLGVGPTRIDKVMGVVKAYTTRVGEGPFPTELNNEIGNSLREKGKEYGATTGRPRRCGWLDGIILRYANLVNHFDALALTKLDVLDDLAEIKICVGYQYNDKKIDYFPHNLEILKKCEPIYITLPGWKEPTSEIKDFHNLPKNAQAYVKYIEKLVGCKVCLLSMGRTKEQTIVRDEKFLNFQKRR